MRKFLFLLVFVGSFTTAPLSFATGGSGVLVEDETSANVYPDGVYYDSVIDQTQTSEAADSTADDVFLPTSDGFIAGTLYIGSNTVFDEILFDVTTAGDSSRLCVLVTCHHYDLEYYDGNTGSWESLSYTDDTNNFESSGVGTWTFDVPDAWDEDGLKTTVNGQTLFWVRLTSDSETTVASPADAGEVALHAYNLEVSVEDELGNALEDIVSESFTVSGGTSTSNSGMRDLGEGVYQLALDTGLSDNNYVVSIFKSGYVDGQVDTGVLSTIQKSASAELQFSHVISVTDEDGDALTPDSVSVEATACTISGSMAYCPLSTSEDAVGVDLIVSKDGYFTADTTLSASRDDSDDAQVMTTVELSIDPEADICEAPFNDIGGHWAEAYIEELYCRDVVNGMDEDTFDPSGHATRAEFLKIALLNANLIVDGSTGESFSDVSTSDWFYEYVAYGAQEGLIEGYDDGTFRPNDTINRAEALVITMRIAGVASYDVDESWEEFGDVSSEDWFAYAVETAADEGIVEGYDDGNFHPEYEITRAEVTALSVRTYDEYYGG